MRIVVYLVLAVVAQRTMGKLEYRPYALHESITMAFTLPRELWTGQDTPGNGPPWGISFF